MSGRFTGHEVDADVLYGEQTRRALENFPVCGRRMSDVPEFVRAYALVKLACAKVNVELGVIDAGRGEAIMEAAQRVADLRHLSQFRTALVQGGGGTSTNMNVNEVIAGLANRILDGASHSHEGNTLVHPNDHVNASQSTNDTYPTAMALALLEVGEPTLVALSGLRDSLLDQARQGGDVHRLGRTCLRDAVSLTVGATHRAHATIIERSRVLLQERLDWLRVLPLGGTVLGTGVGAPGSFSPLAIERLSLLTGRDLAVSQDCYAAMSYPDSYVALAGACSQTATAMAKIAGDFRFLSSGPIGGPNEVALPALQHGSSIMPGKTNPVIPELVMQLGYRVRGATHTAELAIAAGELDVNVMAPVVLDALLTCFRDLRYAAEYFAERCVVGLRWNLDALQHALRGALDEHIEAARVTGNAAVAGVSAGDVDQHLSHDSTSAQRGPH